MAEIEFYSEKNKILFQFNYFYANDTWDKLCYRWISATVQAICVMWKTSSEKPTICSLGIQKLPIHILSILFVSK